jgi:group I intron endonuclease
MFIYQIKNTVTNETYIGKTRNDPIKRLKRHFKNARLGVTSHLYNSMRKHGRDAFLLTIVEENINTDDDLNKREQYWIELLSPAYNMTKGGDGGDVSKSEKWLCSMKKYHASKKAQDYATYGMLGKILSEEAKNQIGKANSYPVSCEGMTFDSIKQAEEYFRSIGCPKSVRKRLDSPNHPSWFRIRPKRSRINPRR